jgi:hypothetical protein
MGRLGRPTVAPEQVARRFKDFLAAPVAATAARAASLAS